MWGKVFGRVLYQIDPPAEGVYQGDPLSPVKRLPPSLIPNRRSMDYRFTLGLGQSPKTARLDIEGYPQKRGTEERIRLVVEVNGESVAAIQHPGPRQSG
jgi:hypothetical protein